MDEIKFANGNFLYEENGSYFIRNKEGQIEKVVKNRFKHNQIVKTATGKHFSHKSFTRLIDPTYIPSRGWCYGENYISRNRRGGGCGFSFEEDMYEEITNPADILYAERFNLQIQIDYLNSCLKKSTETLEKIEFALSVAVPDYTKVIDACNQCGELYTHKNEGNVNAAICKNCRVSQEEKQRIIKHIKP